MKCCGQFWSLEDDVQRTQCLSVETACPSCLRAHIAKQDAALSALKTGEWAVAGVTPSLMWEEIQEIRRIAGDDGAHGAPRYVVKNLVEALSAARVAGEGIILKVVDRIDEADDTVARVYYPDEGNRIDVVRGLSRCEVRGAICHELGRLIDWYMGQQSPEVGDRERNADEIAIGLSVILSEEATLRATKGEP